MYAPEELKEIDGKPEIREMITSLYDLHQMGKPETDEQMEERVDDYFRFCEQRGMRPGVESLCLALHITRTTLFYWSKGQGCSRKRQEITQRAKMFITAFLEQAVVTGRISPPSGIFLLKNWASYKDTLSLEQITNDVTPITASKTKEEIQRMLEQDLPLPEHDD